jgi:SRSO17 transposase
VIDINNNTAEVSLEDRFVNLDANESVEDKPKTVVQFSIPRRTTNLEKQLKENEDIIEGSFVMNTPIIKSGMIMSQLTLYETNATNVLSTQTNYNPLILSMTQYQDRKHMIIANSITQHKDVIIETNALLGNDIVYDWINYTTTVGMDFFFSMLNNSPREYDIEIVDNQMIYPIELIKPSVSRFIPYTISVK